MDTHTERPDWLTVLTEQGRSLRWLALQTDRKPRTVYAYSQGQRVPPQDWLDAVSELLGEPVGHLPRRAA